jgi:phospholipid/cholesterol/gamma-HCH transport system substrate-binding protein
MAIGKLGSGLLRALALAVVGVLVIAGIMMLRGGDEQKTLTASFPRTVSIYEGSDVRVLGVPIGTVDKVEPSGTTVKVTMSYDSSVKIPESAKAAIIAPSVVGDRYVQLTPVYESGPVMKDGASLPESDTGVPLELDQIYQSLDDIAVALGPNGANKEGALTRLLRSTAANFGGQGEQFKETIHNLARFTSTLDNNKEALFGAAREVERFVNALKENDQTVRDFNDSLAAASGVLAGERDDLAAALRNLGVATGEVASFVRENRESLSSNIKGLVQLTGILVKQRDALAETLTDAPVALSNLYHTYNPRSGTLDTRSNFAYNSGALQSDPLGTLCSLISPVQETRAICDQLKQGAGGGTSSGGGGLGGLGGALGGLTGAGRAATGKGPLSKDVVTIEPIDTSLAGILGRTR